MIAITGGVLVGMLAVAALVLLDNGAPKWAVDATIGLAFLIAIPVMITRLREMYRQLR